MGFSTAWAIQNEETSAASARDLLHTAMGGNVGVGGPDHLRVDVLSADTIGLTPGKLSIPAGSSGVRQWQTYGVTVTATDGAATAQITMPSSQARTRHAVVVVNDPEFAGVDGTEPLVELRLVTGVELSGLTVPHYRVATLDIPADEMALTAGMVTDRRSLARPKSETIPVIAEYPQGESESISENTSPGWRTVQNTSLDIPEWATEMLVDATFGGVALYDARFQGSGGIFLEGSEIGSVRVDENYPGYWTRFTIRTGGVIAIPESLRGATTNDLAWRLQWDTYDGVLQVDGGTYFHAMVTFREAPE